MDGRFTEILTKQGTVQREIERIATQLHPKVISTI